MDKKKVLETIKIVLGALSALAILWLSSCSSSLNVFKNNSSSNFDLDNSTSVDSTHLHVSPLK